MDDLPADQPPPTYEEATRTGSAQEGVDIPVASAREPYIRIYFCQYSTLYTLPIYENCPTATSKDSILLIEPTTSFLDLQRRAKARYIEEFSPDLGVSFAWKLSLYTRNATWRCVTENNWWDFRTTIVSSGCGRRETRYLKMDVAPVDHPHLSRSWYPGRNLSEEQRLLLDRLHVGLPRPRAAETGEESHAAALEFRLRSLLDSARRLRDIDDRLRVDCITDLVKEAALILAEASTGTVGTAS